MFAARGFHGVSMDDLGAELGVSGPALYRHFDNKEAILSEMLIEISEQLRDGAKACLAFEGSAAEILEALVHFHIEFALSKPELIAVQFRDLGNVPEKGQRTVRRLQREYVDTWVGVLMSEYPKVGQGRATATSQAVFGLLNSTPHSSRLGQIEMSDLLSEIALAALARGCQSE